MDKLIHKSNGELSVIPPKFEKGRRVYVYPLEQECVLCRRHNAYKEDNVKKFAHTWLVKTPDKFYKFVEEDEMRIL